MPDGSYTKRGSRHGADGMRHLEELQSRKQLELYRTKVSDAGQALSEIAKGRCSLVCLAKFDKVALVAWPACGA